MKTNLYSLLMEKLGNEEIVVVIDKVAGEEIPQSEFKKLTDMEIDFDSKDSFIPIESLFRKIEVYTKDKIYFLNSLELFRGWATDEQKKSLWLYNVRRK